MNILVLPLYFINKLKINKINNHNFYYLYDHGYTMTLLQDNNLKLNFTMVCIECFGKQEADLIINIDNLSCSNIKHYENEFGLYAANDLCGSVLYTKDYKIIQNIIKYNDEISDELINFNANSFIINLINTSYKIYNNCKLLINIINEKKHNLKFLELYISTDPYDYFNYTNSYYSSIYFSCKQCKMELELVAHSYKKFDSKINISYDNIYYYINDESYYFTSKDDEMPLKTESCNDIMIESIL